MDLFLPIVLFIVFCVLFSICGWCCKKHRQGSVYGFAGNPTVTVSTQPITSVIPPYPVSVQAPPVSQPGYAPGGYQTTPYPATTTPYPPAPASYPAQYSHGNSGVPAPYPPPHAAPYPPTSGAPYPPTSGAPYPPTSAPYPPAQLPPSYNEAVSRPPPQPQQMTTSYTKQSPFNPNY